MRNPLRLFIPLASLLLFADCSSKRAIEATLPVDAAPIPVVHDLVRFTLAYNQGAAFSTHFGPYQRWVLIAMALAILVGLGRWYRDIATTGWVGVSGLALVAGGALGNMLDRLRSDRGVVDFIDLGLGTSRLFVCNVADIGVTVGAVLLLWALWRQSHHNSALSA